MSYNVITIGDPAGIGPEIAIKSLIENDKFRQNTIIIGSQKILKYYSEKMNHTYELNIIKDVNEFEQNMINILHVVDIDFDDIKIGKISSIAGDAAYKYLEKAIDLAMSKKIQAVVTGPLNKEALHLGGHNYDGHTEIFANLTNTSKYTMMLWSQKMAVVHVSTHVSLREACDLVKKKRVLECIELADSGMKKMGITKPKIAVAGLNPHSGESGLFGNEEIDEIIPAIKKATKKGYNVEGPVPPDTVFLKAFEKEYDIVVTMYHDQGHIPMKLLDFDLGVNTTLGLPIVRTSVDHGTAFDIAGKGVASAASLLKALEVATVMSN